MVGTFVSVLFLNLLSPKIGCRRTLTTHSSTLIGAESPAEGQEDRVYEEGAHPYDDVWMYEADDVGAMSSFLYTHKTFQNRTHGAPIHHQELH